MMFDHMIKVPCDFDYWLSDDRNIFNDSLLPRVT